MRYFIFLLPFLFSGCATVQNLDPKAEQAAQYLKDRYSYIEPAVQGLVQVAVYAAPQGSDRERIISQCNAVATALDSIVNSRKPDGAQIAAAFKVEESYAKNIFQAVGNVLSAELDKAQKNGFGDLAIEIIKIVSEGIKNGTVQ